MYKKILLVILLSPCFSFAQQKEQTIWLALFNNTHLSEKFGLHLDIQIRTADEAEYIRNLIFRPGLTYHLNKKNSLTVGYAYVETQADPDLNNSSSLIEHRAWEQYLKRSKISRASVVQRLRLEQRFLNFNTQGVFSQRLRYMGKAMIPLNRDSIFKKGFYFALQDEVFFNIQNKEKINNKFFDRNRLSVVAGYRLSEKVEFDAGYLFQYSAGFNTNLSTHALLLNINTRF
jgi:hypothetical protein